MIIVMKKGAPQAAVEEVKEGLVKRGTQSGIVSIILCLRLNIVEKFSLKRNGWQYEISYDNFANGKE